MQHFLGTLDSTAQGIDVYKKNNFGKTGHRALQLQFSVVILMSQAYLLAHLPFLAWVLCMKNNLEHKSGPS